MRRLFAPIWHFEFFYEKVIKVKADVAARFIIFLVLCGFRHISAENVALGFAQERRLATRSTHSTPAFGVS